MSIGADGDYLPTEFANRTLTSHIVVIADNYFAGD